MGNKSLKKKFKGQDKAWMKWPWKKHNKEYFFKEK